MTATAPRKQQTEARVQGPEKAVSPFANGAADQPRARQAASMPPAQGWSGQAGKLRGVLRQGVSMAQYCSWRAGGAARSFYEPADVADLGRFLAQLPPEEPVLFLGLGSNLLVRDGGFAGTVIHMRALPEVLVREGGRGVHAGAGVTLAKLARLCAREGLAGGEFLGGIPGTVGGALAMNAGAYGGETWPLVRAVETMDRQGVLRLRPASDFQPAYRSVQRPADECFVAAHFEFAAGDPAVLQRRLKALIARRNASQPTSQASCGSVFRNPPGDYAGRLIEQAGLKGLRAGGARISDKHANFIVTERGATAADIEYLIGAAQQAVSGRFGVVLHTEAVIVGEAVALGEAWVGGREPGARERGAVQAGSASGGRQGGQGSAGESRVVDGLPPAQDSSGQAETRP